MSLVTNEMYKLDQKNLLHAMKPFKRDNDPFIAKEANGSWVYDIEGNKFMDGFAGLMSVNIGHGRHELAEVVYEQMKRLAYYPMTNSHVSAIELGEKLNEWLNDEYVFFYSNSGSEANETAFKIARQYHIKNDEPQRYKIISRYRAYHGSSFGALAATGQFQRKFHYEPLASGFIHVNPPDKYRSPYSGTEEEIGKAYADEIERVINWEVNKSVAAIILEPIISGGGVIVPPKNYLKEVEKICNKHGVLLIVDEVVNGFGRLGEKFGFMKYGIKPDIITMAKGLTSSYLPLSVTAIRKDLFNVLEKDGDYAKFRHINTFGGNPAACALALKNIEIIENENLIEKANTIGNKLKDDLLEMNHPNIGDIRGEGLLIGIEFIDDQETKEPSERITEIFLNECKTRGLLLGRNGDTSQGYSNVAIVSPPLSITEEEYDFLINTIKDVVHAL